MYYSIVVPTYSRSVEVTELLDSLVDQDYKKFEVIIADGSLDNSVKQVVNQYHSLLNLQYLHEKGLGISDSRNLGVHHAKGDFVVFFDSDCVIPPAYFMIVDKYLTLHPHVDAYGGPDRADNSFSNKQKAISHAMTSYFTTGGIRGGKNKTGNYQPRSFNMGIRREIFNKVKGFSNLRVSEDIDLSIRLKKEGYISSLIVEAYVFHKRRSTFRKFFLQVHSFGRGRVDLQIRHGNSLKPVHLLPSLFVVYFVTGLTISFFFRGIMAVWVGSFMAYGVMLFADSFSRHKNVGISFLSMYAAFVMLMGYGTGMIRAIISRYVFRSREESHKPEITKEA